VGCDPGKQDLLYFASPNGRKADPTQKRGKLKTVNRFRYSQAQRRFETKTKWFNSIREQEKMQHEIEGKTVCEWEHQLSFFKRKSCKFETFKDYIREKNLVNSKLFGFWSQECFRQLKWKAKSLKQKSESKLMNAFRAKFGPPETTLIALGNWSQNRSLAGTQPSMTKGFRVLFKKFGYKTYLVDEFKTSKCCFNCGQELEHHFLRVPNPKFRPDAPVREPTCRCNGCLVESTNNERIKAKPKPTVKCHGLTRCNGCHGSRGMHWNRDLNGALNIWKIAQSMINGEGRPTYLSRKNSNGEEENSNTDDQVEEADIRETNVIKQKSDNNLEQSLLMGENT
jgi:hypothetical protein